MVVVVVAKIFHKLGVAVIWKNVFKPRREWPTGNLIRDGEF